MKLKFSSFKNILVIIFLIMIVLIIYYKFWDHSEHEKKIEENYLKGPEHSISN